MKRSTVSTNRSGSSWNGKCPEPSNTSSRDPGIAACASRAWLTGITESWLPLHAEAVRRLPPESLREAVLSGGEDYELLITLPPERLGEVDPGVALAVIGRVTDRGVELDDAPFPNRGWEHGV